MYSNSAFCLSGSNHRLMYTIAVHPLSTKFRKQSRMYIYNFIGISMQKSLRNTYQETGQNNKINMIFMQLSKNLLTGDPIFLQKHL